MRVLSVTPEFFPLLKTGGLADVAGALPRALAPLGVEVRTLLPAYPAVLAALPDAKPVARAGLAARRPAPGCSRRARRTAPTLLRARRAASVRPAGQPLSRPGRQGLAGQSPPLRRPGAGRRRDRPAAGCRRLAARHRARPRLAGGAGAGLSGPRRRRRARHGADRPQSGLPGPLPGGPAGGARAAAGGVQDRRRRVLRPDRLPQGGPVLCRPADHGEPDLCPRDPDRGRGHGPARPAARARAASWSASPTASTTTSGTRPPTAMLAAPLRRRASAGKAANKAAVQAAVRPGRAGRCLPVLRGQPAHQPERASTCCWPPCPRS